MQGALGDHGAPSGQQVVDLDHGEAIVHQPRLELVVVGLERVPRLTMAVGAVGTHGLAHRPDQLVAELALTAVADDPARRRRST